jgi:hypothetical protein
MSHDPVCTIFGDDKSGAMRRQAVRSHPEYSDKRPPFFSLVKKEASISPEGW